jgi:hypothetical protein
MTVLVAPQTDVCDGSRWLIGLFVMMLSFIAIAENTGKITLSPTYDDRLTEDIYDSGRDWRTPSADEDEWRPEKPQQESRIKFGFDSTYEALRMRDSAQTMNSVGGLGNPEPATQFRIKF